MYRPSSLRRVLAVTMFALTLALTPAPANAASGWDTALPSAAVGSYVDGTGVRVLVAAAGAGADPAVTALTASLRALPNVKLTMPDDALGNLSTIDDAAIVAKAKALPIDLVVVVRVFPGNSGAENLVATLYRVDGTVVSAFTAGTDAPLAARKTTGAGMAGATASAVDSVVGGNTADFDSRVKAFEERAIWMQGYAAVDARSGRIVSTWSVPMKGKYGEAFRGPKFYEYIGRDDYAASFKKRQGTRAIMALSGAAALGGGGAALLFGVQTDPDLYPNIGPCKQHLDENLDRTPEFRSCASDVTKSNATATAVGITLASVGFVTVMVPIYMSPHPVKPNERSRLVDEYNEALREELGLPKVRPTSLGATFSAGGWAGPDGGGAQVAGTF